MSKFNNILRGVLDKNEINYDDRIIEKLSVYYELLIEWNQKLNLTALTEPHDVALKHFADCLSLLKYTDIEKEAEVIDVGTGAGFPGLVLKIARPDIKLTLLDSLNKRLVFLEEVCGALGICDVELIHSRAEEGSRTNLRDSFDIAVSRAVAPLTCCANTICHM